VAALIFCMYRTEKRPKIAKKCRFVQEALKNKVARGMVKVSLKATKQIYRRMKEYES